MGWTFARGRRTHGCLELFTMQYRLIHMRVTFCAATAQLCLHFDALFTVVNCFCRFAICCFKQCTSGEIRAGFVSNYLYFSSKPYVRTCRYVGFWFNLWSKFQMEFWIQLNKLAPNRFGLNYFYEVTINFISFCHAL